jgi:hypothetical protein
MGAAFLFCHAAIPALSPYFVSLVGVSECQLMLGAAVSLSG